MRSRRKLNGVLSHVFAPFFRFHHAIHQKEISHGNLSKMHYVRLGVWSRTKLPIFQALLLSCGLKGNLWRKFLLMNPCEHKKKFKILWESHSSARKFCFTHEKVFFPPHKRQERFDIMKFFKNHLCEVTDVGSEQICEWFKRDEKGQSFSSPNFEIFMMSRYERNFLSHDL